MEAVAAAGADSRRLPVDVVAGVEGGWTMSKQMPEREQMKPCPFCGFNEPELEVDTGIVWCPNCRCESPRDRGAWGVESDQVDLTPELWNRRTPAPGSVVVDGERLKEVVEKIVAVTHCPNTDMRLGCDNGNGDESTCERCWEAYLTRTEDAPDV